MTVMTFLVRIRLATFVLLLHGLMVAAPAVAQKLGPDGAPNPTASVTSERELLKQFPRVEGRIDIPDAKEAVLIQPAGRTWDYFHEVLLHRGGAIVILGTIALLGLAYMILGRIRIAAGRSGQKILRFKSFERFSHWLTAVSFVALGLTGLNITFGLIVLIFFKDNLPERVDIDWLRQGGGFVKGKHAPAGRFNLGEKLVYWLSVAAGIGVSVSGFLLLFPFYGTDIADMQLAQVVHAVVAVLFVALILGHIYIGTLGIEGAFEAMG